MWSHLRKTEAAEVAGAFGVDDLNLVVGDKREQFVGLVLLHQDEWLSFSEHLGETKHGTKS